MRQPVDNVLLSPCMDGVEAQKFKRQQSAGGARIRAGFLLVHLSDRVVLRRTGSNCGRAALHALECGGITVGRRSRNWKIVSSSDRNERST